MKGKILVIVVGLAFTVVLSCKEPYNIPVISTDQSFLVVEGNLNCGQGPTTVHLSRTFKLNDAAQVQPETGAQLAVEGKDNTSSFLSDLGNGDYYSAQLGMTIGSQYRLHIKTASGKEYFSDFVTALNNPPIDSINWVQQNGGLQIYTNTHDPQNSALYYRWDYTETWEIHSYYTTNLKVVNGQVLPRGPGEMVNVCFKTDNSTSILLGTSAKLASNVIYEAPLVFIPHADEKLSVRYSILVNQYALTKDAWQYFQVMKKNTESLGSIFDAQPAELTGNIHSVTDASEKVIGYVTASPLQQQRIFITNNQVPGWGYSMACQSVKVPNDPDSIATYFPAVYLPYQPIINGLVIVGYWSSDPGCVDCTINGGSVIRPSYW